MVLGVAWTSTVFCWLRQSQRSAEVQGEEHSPHHSMGKVSLSHYKSIWNEIYRGSYLWKIQPAVLWEGKEDRRVLTT